MQGAISVVCATAADPLEGAEGAAAADPLEGEEGAARHFLAQT